MDLTPRVFSNHASTHGEGPVWNEETSTLAWVDIKAGKIHSCSFDDPEAVSTFSFGKQIGCFAYVDSSTIIAGLEDGLALYHVGTGRLKSIGPGSLEKELSGHRINDGKCDPLGRFWFGSMPLEGEDKTASLYRLHSDMRVEAVLRGVSASNGLVWTDEFLYFIDSPTKRIDRFPFDYHSGKLDSEGRETVIRFSDEGYPDGMCNDGKGNLWVAFWGGKRVSCVDPKAGSEIARVSLPVKNVSSCCFGGPKLDHLFITTAKSDETETEAGKVFVIKPGISGYPMGRYQAKAL